MEGEHRGEGLSGLFPFFSLLPIILHCPYHPIFIAHKGDQMSSTAMKIALTFTAIDAASATIGTLGRHLGSLGEAGKRAQKDFDSMTRSMTEGLKGLTATWLAFEKLKPVISIAAGMQESMTKLEISLARSGQNAAVFNAELEKMRDAAGKLQVLFPFGQKEMIEAATVLAQSGMKAEDISSPTGALFSVGASASLGDISTIEAAKAIAQLGSIFNLKGSQLGEAADWMQQIGKTTLLHVADMGPALSEGGQLAKQYHLNAKDTITALATLAQQSGSASKAGDELQEFLSRLQGVGKQGKKAMEEAGLNFFDSRGNLKNFHEIVKTLQAWEETPQMRAMTEQQRLDIREKIFGLRGQRAASAFAARGDNSLASIEERAAKSLHIQEALDIIQKDLTQQYRALIGTIKTAIADGFAPMLPALSSLTARLNEAASAADEFAKRHPEGMKKAEEIGAGAMGIGFVWSIFKIFKGLRHGLSGLKALAGLGGMGMDLVEGKATAAITRAMPVFIVAPRPAYSEAASGCRRSEAQRRT